MTRTSTRERKATSRYAEEIEPPIPPPQPKKRRKQPPAAAAANTRKPKPPPPPPSQKNLKKETTTPTGSSLHKKTKQGNSYYIKPKPQISFPSELPSISIQTVTANQITKALKKQYRPTKKDKESLIQITSHQNRAKIYMDAAKAIAKKEANALPSHGARPWFVQIIIGDDQGAVGRGSSAEIGSGVGDDGFEIIKDCGNGKKGKKANSPLFVWNKYHLELAILPHILNGIDEIDTNHGLLKSVKEEVLEMELELEEGYVTDDDDYINQLMERSITLLSTVAFQDTSFCYPTIERKWMSPDLVSFRSRNGAVQHSLMLLDRDKVIDRALHGVGARGAMLRGVKPTRTVGLEAGFLRFVRDGLWVVGQEDDWVLPRIDLLDQQEQEQEQEQAHDQEHATEVPVEEQHSGVTGTFLGALKVYVAPEGSIYRSDLKELLVTKKREEVNKNCVDKDNHVESGKKTAFTQSKQNLKETDPKYHHPLYEAPIPSLESKPSNMEEWNASLLILVPLRLGLKQFNASSYKVPLAHMLSFPQSVGFIGGSPRHALWFYGANSDGSKVYGLDPHTVQRAPRRRKLVPHEMAGNGGGRTHEIIFSDEYLRSIHCPNGSAMDMTKIDPSLALGFYCCDRKDYESFEMSLKAMKEDEELKKYPELFTISDAKPDYSADLSSAMMVMMSCSSPLLDGDIDVGNRDEDDEYIML
jgi:hypothetical protein